MATKLTYDQAVKKLKDSYKNGNITKENYDIALKKINNDKTNGGKKTTGTRTSSSITKSQYETEKKTLNTLYKQGRISTKSYDKKLQTLNDILERQPDTKKANIVTINNTKINTDKIVKYKYKLKKMQILIGKDTIDIPVERFSGLSISKNFLEDLYPIIKISLVIASDTYYLMQKNKNNLKFYLRIDKFQVKYNSKTNKYAFDEEPTYKKWLNKTFDLLLDENTEDLDTEEKEDNNLDDYTVITKNNSDKLDRVDNKVTFYLFTALDELKKNINKVFENATVTDALCYIFDEAGFNNVIMEKADNTKKYSSFFIPAGSLSNAYRFIDSYYGIYQYGSIFFVDTDYTYVLPFNRKVNARIRSKQTNTINILIPRKMTSHKFREGCYETTKNGKKVKYIVGNPGNMDIKNASISNDYINGSDAKVVDTYTGQIIKSSSTSETKSDTAVTKFKQNNTLNSYYSDMQTAISNSLSTVILLSLNDFDISMLALNKNYNIIFEDNNYSKKYEGNYNISAVSTDLIKEGDNMVIHSSVELRKNKELTKKKHKKPVSSKKTNKTTKTTKSNGKKVITGRSRRQNTNTKNNKGATRTRSN